MKILYRAHAILHQFATQLVFEIFPIAIQLLYIIMISTFFIVLRRHENLSSLFLLALSMIGLTVCISLQVSFKLGYQLTEDSAVFLKSFTQSKSRYKTKENRQFFRSCQRFRLNIGNFFKVSRNTFPAVMHEIILNTVINLLVTVPPTTNHV